MTSDLELLGRWRAGQAAAGSELFKRHFDGLYRFFVNKVDTEAEDLIQKTLLACVRYQDALDRVTSFKAYLFTVARNELYRHLRQRRPQGVDFTIESVTDLGPSPTTLLGDHQRDRKLLGALRSLPVESQVLLELHYWEELSTAELATVLGIPHGTAKTRLRAAKQRLAKALQQAHEPEASDALELWIRSMRARLNVAASSPQG
jgi:RNA polymerase sigma factor (sigma-70 family)